MTLRPSIKIELTPEQQQQIEQRTGKQVKTLELKLEALERRATPGIWEN